MTKRQRYRCKFCRLCKRREENSAYFLSRISRNRNELFCSPMWWCWCLAAVLRKSCGSQGSTFLTRQSLLHFVSSRSRIFLIWCWSNEFHLLTRCRLVSQARCCMRFQLFSHPSAKRLISPATFLLALESLSKHPIGICWWWLHLIWLWKFINESTQNFGVGFAQPLTCVAC